jgi:HD-GYP domain-containing protein (c-di-GMP phosphodiesterase class II)
METARFNALELKLRRLLDLATAITAEADLDRLLDLILKAGVELTLADAGSVYIRENDKLFFRIALNKTLSQRDNKGLTQSFGRTVSIPISEKSAAGYTALRAAPLNIADAYSIPPEMPFSHKKEFDVANKYECHSMLLSPLKNHRDEVVGVIQLINARYVAGRSNWQPFNEEDERLIQSLSSLAGTAVTKSILVSELYETYKLVMTRMALAVEQREGDPDTLVHIYRIAQYAVEVAQEMGLDTNFQKYLLDAAPMHDIGKQCIPDAVLFKPGKLTPEEFDVVKRHTIYGCRLFENMNEPIAKFAFNICRHHHEKFNGMGYPDRLVGEAIPLESRIVAVVDVFDALATDRVYKKAMPLEQCMEIMHKDSNTHFDPAVVQAFVKRLPRVLDIRERFEEVKRNADKMTIEEISKTSAMRC